MRIIAGRLKGRKLKNFKASHLRPTTDRVKETVFNKLMAYVSEARVLDLFAGTGNLSIEALSRGAREVVAVENSKQSLSIISSNLKELGVVSGIKVVPKGVLPFLASYDGPSFDIILVDPPFTEKMAHEVMLSLVKSSVLGDESIVMIEASSHERVDDLYGDFELWDRKKFGDKSASFFIKVGS